MPFSVNLRVFIVDDHYLILHGLSSLLLEEPGFEISGITQYPGEVLAMLEKSPTDILLTDISMPVISGAQLTVQVLEKFPHIRVIALSMFNEPKVVNELIEAGVCGYILKDTSKAELIKAIHTVAGGQKYFSSQIHNGFNERNEIESTFTGREIEILKLIVREYSNRQISKKLYISERTVETHRRNILKKTKTGSTVGLVKYAYQHNIV